MGHIFKTRPAKSDPNQSKESNTQVTTAGSCVALDSSFHALQVTITFQEENTGNVIYLSKTTGDNVGDDLSPSGSNRYRLYRGNSVVWEIPGQSLSTIKVDAAENGDGVTWSCQGWCG